MTSINSENIENIEQIATIIVHELKSPLALISANIDYLKLCDEEKKFTKNYSVIKKEVEKANRILNDFISILSGSDTPAKNTCICDIISEVTANYIETYGDEISFTFDFKASKTLSGSTTDKMAYAIVFNNTIKNAVEAIKAAKKTGSGKIDIISDFEGENIILKIIDNGIGLREAELDLIDKSEYFTTKELGSGVGINICKKIMCELGGSYKILDNLGSGCVVEIKVNRLSR